MSLVQYTIHQPTTTVVKQSVSIGNDHKIESKKSTYKNKDLVHRAMAFQPTMEAQSIFIGQ